MTFEEAKQAMADRTRVCGGKPGTEDYDEGYIIEVDEEIARVAFDSGVIVACALSILEEV